MVFTTAGGGATQETGYEIDNSLRTGGGDNHHLSMVYSSSASNRKTWTFSGWIKLGQAAHFSQNYPNEKYLLTATDAAVSTTHIGYGGYTSGNAGSFFLGDGRSGTYIETTSKFRDPSAWYHLVVRYDSTQGTASNRIFIYVNGVAQTLNYSNTGDPEVDLNTEVDFFLAGDNVDATSADSGNFVHNINSYYNSGFDAINNSFDGHFADWYLINAQSLAPTEFGETNENGVWIPKKYTGTFNSHSFHLEFKQTGSSADASGIGADTSGQDNHFKVGVNSTLSAVDITTDTPTNNFATLNPLNSSASVALSEGNTKHTNSGANDQASAATMGFTKGKWYWEVKCVDKAEVGINLNSDILQLSNDSTVGSNDANIKATSLITNSAGGINDLRHNGSNESITSVSVADGDIISVAVDADNGKIWFAKNGTYFNSGNPATGSNEAKDFSGAYTSGNFIIPVGLVATADGDIFEINFGNPPFSISSGNSDANGYGNFEYAVPSGYYALCTKNLATYG